MNLERFRQKPLMGILRGVTSEQLAPTLESAVAAGLGTLEITMKQERLLHGEPSERTAVSIEDTIKREYERWMVVEDEASDPHNDRDADGDDADDVGRPRPGGGR